MPDLDQIKQGEQVTTSALEGPAWRFAGIPSVGITDAVEVLVFLIWQLLHWLLFGCKNSQERPRASVCERAVRQCYRPHPAAPTNRPIGRPSLLLVLLAKPDLMISWLDERTGARGR